MSGFKERLTKPLIVGRAAQGLAQWIVDNQITAADLERRLLAGEDILANALAGADKAAINAVRGAVGDVVQSMGAADYQAVLARLWEIPETRDHALLLGRPDIRQRYFDPAMERVKRWLATGSPA